MHSLLGPNAQLWHQMWNIPPLKIVPPTNVFDFSPDCSNNLLFLEIIAVCRDNSFLVCRLQKVFIKLNDIKFRLLMLRLHHWIKLPQTIDYHWIIKGNKQTYLVILDLFFYELLYCSISLKTWNGCQDGTRLNIYLKLCNVCMHAWVCACVCVSLFSPDNYC